MITKIQYSILWKLSDYVFIYEGSTLAIFLLLFMCCSGWIFCSARWWKWMLGYMTNMTDSFEKIPMWTGLYCFSVLFPPCKIKKKKKSKFSGFIFFKWQECGFRFCPKELVTDLWHVEIKLKLKEEFLKHQKEKSREFLFTRGTEWCLKKHNAPSLNIAKWKKKHCACVYV